MPGTNETERLLVHIETNAQTLVSAVRAIMKVRAAGEDDYDIGAKAEHDVVFSYEAIGDALRALKLIK